MGLINKLEINHIRLGQRIRMRQSCSDFGIDMVLTGCSGFKAVVVIEVFERNWEIPIDASNQAAF